MLLALWMGVHRLVMGVSMAAGHAGYVGPQHLETALEHNFLKAGRPILWLCSLPLLLSLASRRGRLKEQALRREMTATTLGPWS